MKRKSVALLYSVSLAASTLAIARPALADPPYAAADLGVLSSDPSGFGISDAILVGNGLNNAGQVAGYSFIFDGYGDIIGQNAFLYTGGQMINLGTIGSPNSFAFSYSTAKALNNNGQVAGEAAVYNAQGDQTGTHAFLYTGGQMTDLGTLGTLSPDTTDSSTSTANAMNDAGQVVGDSDYGVNGALGRRAFLYSGNQMMSLGALSADPFSNYSYSTASAINASGQVVGYSQVYDSADNGGSFLGRRAFLYAGGPMNSLGTLVSDGVTLADSFALAINDAGQVVGSSSVNGGAVHAFLYTSGPMNDLGVIGAIPDNTAGNSQAVAINGSGQVIGNSDAWDTQGHYLGRHAFLYENGQMKDLGTLSTNLSGIGQSVATGINDAGQVVGYYTVYTFDTPSTQHAFVYANGQMTDLNDVIGGSDLVLNFSRGINASGQIACSATTGLGSSHVALLSPGSSTTSDTTPPVIQGVSSDIIAWATSAAGAVVSFPAPTATDDVDGSVPVSCSPASGSTFPLGTTTVNISAADAAGNTATANFHVTVRYSWSGFLAPTGGGNKKAGSNVPVAFQLTGPSAAITNAVATLTYAKITGGVPGTALPADAPGNANIGNAFHYDAALQQYTFNWCAKGLTAGTYRLAIDLGDGVDRHVDVTLK